MGNPAIHPISESEGPVEPVHSGMRRCLSSGIGAGSMVALLLVLTVMPGAAAFAAPEAMGHISIILHEVVRPKPDRGPREPEVSVGEQRSAQAVVVALPRQCSDVDLMESVAVPALRSVSHRSRAEAFAARPWCMSTPPPAN